MSQSKMGLVVDMVRGKKVEEALAVLQFTPKRAARVVEKTIQSAVANAGNNFQLSPETLRIARISADRGPVLKRVRAKARGRINPILKRSCHVTVVLEEVGGGT